MRSRAFALALLAAAACGRAPGGAPPTTPGAATVVRVVDGDTLVAHVAGHDETVRLIGIDTPETKKPDAPVECFGAEAGARLAALLPEGTAITLVRDVEARDKYGRLLAYVYRASDGLFVNLALAADGFAAAFTFPPNVAHADELVGAAAAARAAGTGLWAACGGPDTPVGR